MSKLKITREQEEKLKEFEWHTTSKEHAYELYKKQRSTLLWCPYFL